MKTILTLLIVALCLITRAQHSIEIGYTGGINNHAYVATDGSSVSMLNSGGVMYKFIGKKNVGVLLGVEISGYKFYGPGRSTAKFSGYSSVSNKSIYLSTPLMFAIRAGKKKVKFTFHTGAVVTYALKHSLNYTYSQIDPFVGPNNHTVHKETTENYSWFRPLKFGIPLGIGVHIDLSEKLYMVVNLEDRFLFGKIATSEGLINTFGIRVALGVNIPKKA